MLIKYTQSQESKTHRSQSKHIESLHRPRSRQREGIIKKEPYTKSYCPRKEVFQNTHIVDTYPSSTYPKKEYKN